MPFYEYECDNCKFYTELLQKVSDEPLRKCPSCGKNAMKKLISAPVFRLKGGGWYETDFKTDKEGKRNLAVDKEPEAPSESKPAAKAGDAKAEKAAESKTAEPAAATATARTGSGASRSGSSRQAARKPSRPAAAKGRTKPAARGKARAPARRKGR